MPDNPLTAKAGLAVGEFRAGIATINQSMRELSSQFKADAAALGDWSKTASGVESRIGFLTKAIDLQREKVEKLKGQRDAEIASGKATASSTSELTVKINKATEELNKYTNELGEDEKALAKMTSGSGEAGKAVQDLGEKSKQSGSHLETLKSVLGGLGTVLKASLGAITAVIGAIGAMGAAVIGLAKTTIQPASDLNETVSKIGVVFGENSQEVIKFGEAAAQSLGLSENAALTAAGTYGNLFKSMGMSSSASADMSVNLVKLAGDLASFNNIDNTEALDKLRAGLTGETEPLKSLGININQAAIAAKALELGLIPASLSTAKIAQAALTAEKAQTAYNTALQRYGEGSAQATEAAIKLQLATEAADKAAQGSANDLSPAQKAQAAYALIMQQSTLAQGDFARTSGGLANQQRILTAQFENAKASIGGAFLPVVTEAAVALNKLLASPFVQSGIETLKTGIGQLTKIVKPFLDVLGNFKGDFGQLAKAGTAIVTQLISSLAAQMPQFLQSGLLILQTLIQSLTASLPALLPMALSIISSLLGFLVTALPQLMDAGVQILLMLINGLVAALPGLVTAALTMIITLVNGLAAALPLLIPLIASVIPQIITILLQNLPLLITAAISLILALVQGIQNAQPQLYAQMPVIVTALFDALTAAAPLLQQAGFELLKMLGQGFVTNIPLLLSSIKQVVIAIFDGLYNYFSTNMPIFYGQIKTFFAGIVTAAKAALGIKSPSSVFALEVGAQIPPGVGQGIAGAMPQLQRDLGRAMGGLTRGIEVGISANLRGSASGGLALAGAGGVTVGDIYVDARGSTQPQAVGAAVREGVLSVLRAKGVR